MINNNYTKNNYNNHNIFIACRIIDKQTYICTNNEIYLALMCRIQTFR